MNWQDAYEQRIVLWRFWQTATARRYVEGFARDVTEKGRAHEAAVFEALPEFEAAKLLAAEPIFVDADMVDLVEAAAEGFEPEPFEEEDLLVPAAFVLLERPFILRDFHGRVVSDRAISWRHAMLGTAAEGRVPGVQISYYAHRDDPDDYYDGSTLHDPRNPLSRYELTMSHINAWEFGRPPSEMRLTGTGRFDPDQAQRSHEALWVRTQVLMRLMLQRLSTVEPRRVNRAARRRACREMGDERDRVTVVTLRRLRHAAEEAAEKGAVAWTHRWAVRGHWRRQWYPSLGRHRRIWISPYIKGPEGAELRLKDRAYQLVR